MLINIDIDPIEDENIYEWIQNKVNSNNRLVKLALTIGIDVIEKVASSIDNEVVASVEYKMLQQENLSLVERMEEEISKRVQQSENNMDRVMNQLKYENTSLQRLIEEKSRINNELEKSIRLLVAEFKDGEIQRIKHQLQEKEYELRTLKSTNAAKGIIGESLIINTLRNNFTEYSINHTGNIAHQCDVHMTDEDGNIIAFESKLKSSITKMDIEKFYNDITHLAESETQDSKIIGGMFVSICSPNIPYKGSIHLEKMELKCNQKNIPLIFLGFQDQEEFKLHFPVLGKMFVKLSKIGFMIDDDKHTDIDVNGIFDNLTSMLDMLVKNKNKINEFRVSTAKLTDDLEENNKCIINTVMSILQQHGKLEPSSCLSTVNHSGRLKPSRSKHYTCDICNREIFTNKKQLQKHQKECKI